MGISFNKHVDVIITLGLLNLFGSIMSAVMISSSPRADVCHVGDTLEVTCNLTNSSESVLQWSLNFATEIGMTPRLSSTISSTNQNARTEILDSMIFTFSRSSELNALPLTSTLVVRLVQNSLNGTRISCTEGLGGVTETSANTTVCIVGNNLGELM